jgi:hypothetical protein
MPWAGSEHCAADEDKGQDEFAGEGHQSLRFDLRRAVLHVLAESTMN